MVIGPKLSATGDYKRFDYNQMKNVKKLYDLE